MKNNAVEHNGVSFKEIYCISVDNNSQIMF